MGNIIDFIKLQGAKTFAEMAFTPNDAVVMCQLCYLKLEYLFPKRSRFTLADSLVSPFRDSLFEDERFGEEQRRVFFEALFSERYRDMEISAVSSVVNEETEMCFCALVFRPKNGSAAVVFRGTDEYIVGWKEDFKMAFMSPVPSQSMSVKYLARVAEEIEGDFFVCGHSKGGNLAVYSALNSSPKVRSRIKMIYNLDGPGFRETVTNSPEYKELRSRMVKLIPQSSFVGRLLQNVSVCRVVESSGVGLMQHDLLSWSTDSFGDIIFRDEGIYSSKMMNTRLSENIAALPREQIERFVEALFGILKNADVNNLVEFGKNWMRDGKRLLDAYNDLDDDTRRLLGETVGALLAW